MATIEPPKLEEKVRFLRGLLLARCFRPIPARWLRSSLRGASHQLLRNLTTKRSFRALLGRERTHRLVSTETTRARLVVQRVWSIRGAGSVFDVAGAGSVFDVAGAGFVFDVAARSLNNSIGESYGEQFGLGSTLL